MVSYCSLHLLSLEPYLALYLVSLSFSQDFICGNPRRMGVKPIPSEKVYFGLCFPHEAALTNGSLISVILFWGYIQCELESHTSIDSGLSHEPSSSSFVSFVMQFP